MKRRPCIAVIGASTISKETWGTAQEVGRRIAEKGWTLVTGGLGGVMEAASQGAAEAGGIVVGILPQGTIDPANPFVHIPIATNMGHARNVIIAHSAEAIIAVEGSHGTLSEIAIALKLEKPVIGLGTWNIPGISIAQDALHAITMCEQALLSGGTA